ncbi:hypothetical protein M3F32_07785 [Dietzia cinnamea]|uniref:hypothetical protein n=1 Tax=Dietzia cinnamea TaxID=321318 RepID=UPI00223ADE34|nr:hypothetical protein [Dietzia cinnamea]MCT2264489.1 hypothetical protein [Dietzia cinnamea]
MSATNNRRISDARARELAADVYGVYYALEDHFRYGDGAALLKAAASLVAAERIATTKEAGR